MKTYEGASSPGRFTTGEKPPPHPCTHWVGPRAGLNDAEKRKIRAPIGTRTPSPREPVVRRYTDSQKRIPNEHNLIIFQVGGTGCNRMVWVNSMQKNEDKKERGGGGTNWEYKKSHKSIVPDQSARRLHLTMTQWKVP
jgi:hypothetical protein